MILIEETEMEKNNQIYLTYWDDEKLPYVIAFMKKNIPNLREFDIQYKRVDKISPYFIIEWHSENMKHRSIIDIRLSGHITPMCVADLNHYANIFTGDDSIIERIFIVSNDCNTSLIPLNFKTVSLNEIIRFEKSMAL